MAAPNSNEKSMTRSRKSTRNIYPTDHSAGAKGSSGAMVDNGQTLADLVWKYFSDEITEAGNGSAADFGPGTKRPYKAGK
jgi:hypothetical protein